VPCRSAYDNSKKVEAKVKDLDHGDQRFGASGADYPVTGFRPISWLRSFPGSKAALRLTKNKKSVGRRVVNYPRCVCRTCISNMYE
jgi:hypothetical protein